MGAGLGGGSSDAAHVIRLLNDIFILRLSQAQMMELAASIGSDTAFFIQDKPMIGQGRGEVLTPADVSLSGKYIVLVNPDIHVSTSEAYAQVKPQRPETSLGEILSKPMIEWRALLKNDFETSVFAKYPAIKEMKDRLYSKGALYASMSGSGATVFGIFEKEFDASAEFPNTTVWASYL
jgi:4-diphosphocytidyl-2-C-methyl-D-erythritol kinase